MFTDPAELLRKYQHLSYVDFVQLGDGSTADGQYWVESMESALEATDYIVDGGTTMDIREALKSSKQKTKGAFRSNDKFTKWRGWRGLPCLTNKTGLVKPFSCFTKERFMKITFFSLCACAVHVVQEKDKSYVCTL